MSEFPKIIVTGPTGRLGMFSPDEFRRRYRDVDERCIQWVLTGQVIASGIGHPGDHLSFYRWTAEDAMREAGPELLAACEAAIGNSHGLDPEIDRQLRAAVAKARGD